MGREGICELRSVDRIRIDECPHALHDIDQEIQFIVGDFGFEACSSLPKVDGPDLMSIHPPLSTKSGKRRHLNHQMSVEELLIWVIFGCKW